MTPTVAVVPIFVNAGAAVLPAVLGALASAAALLFKPRQLIAACRRRPLVPLSILVLGAVAGVAIWMFAGEPAADRRVAAALTGTGADTTDWVKVGLELKDDGDPVSPNDTPTTSQTPSTIDSTTAPIGLGRDVSRCGYDGGVVPLGLRLLWQHDQEDAWFLSSPAVIGGRVYCASCQSDVTGKLGTVFCLDARNGKVIWQAPSPGQPAFKPFFSSPAISADGKYLVIGQGLHPDDNCELLCLETSTGRVHWSVKTPLHIESSPAIRGDMVVAGAGAIEDDEHKATGHPGLVIAVRISDGKPLWQAQVNDPESSPAIAEDGLVYIGSGFNGNAIVALRSETDEQLKTANLPRIAWRAPAPYPITGGVTLADDLLIVGGGNSDYVYAAPHPAGVVLALDRRTGAVRWRTALPDAVLGTIAAHHGKLICPVRDGRVLCLDARDGHTLWQASISGKSAVLTGCALAGQYAYAASRDGYLGVIDTETAKVVQRVALNADGKPGHDGLCVSSPTIAGGCVFIGSETGGLRCFTGTARSAP